MSVERLAHSRLGPASRALPMYKSLVTIRKGE
jgi:hypothetical protein